MSAEPADSPWQTVVEPASGDCYWWNTLTSETSWDRPAGAPPAPPPPRPADAADAAAGAVVDASGGELCGPDDAFDFADAGGGLCGPDDGFDYGDAGGALCGPDDAVFDGAAAGGMSGAGHAGYAGQGPRAFNAESDSDDSEEERIAFERDKVRMAWRYRCLWLGCGYLKAFVDRDLRPGLCHRIGQYCNISFCRASAPYRGLLFGIPYYVRCVACVSYPVPPFRGLVCCSAVPLTPYPSVVLNCTKPPSVPPHTHTPLTSSSAYQVAQFRHMLEEKSVPAFANWEKWLPKLVADARFLLLPKDDRRSVFTEYVKSRVRHVISV